MLKQNKKLHFWLKSEIFAILAFGIALFAMFIRIEATWGGLVVDSNILYIFLGVIVVLIVGFVYYAKSLQFTKAPDSDSYGTKDLSNPNQES